MSKMKRHWEMLMAEASTQPKVGVEEGWVPQETRKTQENLMLWAEAAMLGLQVFCCGESMCRGLWWKALYWFGAFLLTIAIVRGLKT